MHTLDCWQFVFLLKFSRDYEARHFRLEGIGTRHGHGMRLWVHTALLHSQSLLNTCLSDPKRKDRLLAVYAYLIFAQNLSLRWCLSTLTVP